MTCGTAAAGCEVLTFREVYSFRRKTDSEARSAGYT